jgi:hypothetical protein
VLPAAILVTAEVLITQMKYLLFITARFHLFSTYSSFIIPVCIFTYLPSYSIKDIMSADIFPVADIVTTNTAIVSVEKLCQFSSLYQEVLILATLHTECHSDHLEYSYTT